MNWIPTENQRELLLECVFGWLTIYASQINGFFIKKTSLKKKQFSIQWIRFSVCENGGGEGNIFTDDSLHRRGGF